MDPRRSGPLQSPTPGPGGGGTPDSPGSAVGEEPSSPPRSETGQLELDGGTEAQFEDEYQSASACFRDLLRRDDLVLSLVFEEDGRAQMACAAQARRESEELSLEDRRERCGPRSEHTWNQSNERLSALMGAMMLMLERAGDRPERQLWADTECQTLSEREFGAALHLAALVPQLTDERFIRCAIERQSSREDFGLWSALDVARSIEDPQADLLGLEGTNFTDPRTLRRISRLGLPNTNTSEPSGGNLPGGNGDDR